MFFNFLRTNGIGCVMEEQKQFLASTLIGLEKSFQKQPTSGRMPRLKEWPNTIMLK
jgi:hypothetical protein